uniref:Uncharacterized protein n=1 Tax=Anopheles atroparvus TaxID=41427 RepID=A0A182JEY3_ANOAO
MKLCLLLVAAVTVVTCYALPVPKEEVFTVYPVNSGLAQNTTELPVDAKPEPPSVPVANVASTGETVSEKPVENNKEQLKTLPVQEKPVETPVKEESVKAAPSSAVETVAVPSKEVVETRPVDVPAPVSEAVLNDTPLENASEDDTVGEPEMVVIIEEPVLVSEITEPKLVSGVVEPTVVSGVIEPTLVSGVIGPMVVGGVVETTPVATEAKSAETKEDTAPVEKATGDEKPKADAVTLPQENALKSVDPSQGEKKVDAPAEAAKDEQKKAVEPEVKQTPADNKLEKLTEQPKVEAAAAATQVRSAANDEPKVTAEQKEVVQSVVEVAAEKVEEKKPVEEKPMESKVEVAPEVRAAVAAVEAPKQPALSANDLQPQTEGRAEEKPTKVRAVPIVEGLKVAQPVEAEPAITKIHVTVIQEEIPLRPESAAEQKPVAVAPVAVSEEKKLEPVTTVSVSPAMSEDAGGNKPTDATEVESPVVKTVELRSAPVAVEKPSEVKAEVASDKPAEVQSVESVGKSDAEAKVVEPKPVEAKKEEPSVKSSLVEATTVVPSVNAEDATTVVASSEKPEQVVTVQAVPVTEKKPEEEVTTVAVDVKPEAPKSTEQLAKAADGSSQPATTQSSDTVKEVSKDQGNGDSTTVTAAPEADGTTLAPVTEPEPVPTPAKQKGKKQAPLDLKGYRQRLKQMEALTKKSGGSE